MTATDHAQKLAKARQARSRKKGKLKRFRAMAITQEVVSTQEDPNVSILTPKSKDEKDRERKDRIRRELAIREDSKWSNKKKKRLEKYIEKKLKKEERMQLFEKLAETQAEIPSSFHLQSSSSLGTRRLATHQERLEQIEDQEVRRTLSGRLGKRRRTNAAFAMLRSDEEHSDAEIDESTLGRDVPSPNKKSRLQPNNQEIAIANPIPTPIMNFEPPSVGSALKLNPDGSAITPIVRKRSKRKGFILGSWSTSKAKAGTPVASGSDTSFDSSDSSYDSSSDGQDVQSTSSDNGLDERDTSDIATCEISTVKEGLGFKQWAKQQLSKAKGYTEIDPPYPSTSSTQTRKMESSQPVQMRGPLGKDLKLPDTAFVQHLTKQSAQLTKAKAVIVSRHPDVEESRALLPIVSEEQPLMEAILLNPVVIICGETGSGKTTQVPQFLYEAGFGTAGSENPGIIGITQPRRVAAMSMAARVAHELTLNPSRVSYQIRYDATVSSATVIKFMTDGVLLRELATDFLLSKYSVIIIDEAHERSLNTDILIGVLSRVVGLREARWKEGKEGTKPLRLIIMSATLRVNDFVENKTLFSSPPPVINVTARQYPVTIHFSRRTAADYVAESVKKASKIHTRLPPGGILIFLTGQNEIAGVCRKLETKFGFGAVEARRKKRDLGDSHNGEIDNSATLPQIGNVVPEQADIEAEDLDFGDNGPSDLAFDIDKDVAEDDPDALDSDREQAITDESGVTDEDVQAPMHVVPLYSLLPSEKQMRVFEPPPLGSRLVVVSTNVAETSLTIPGIRYVIDCGRAKERRYDGKSGIQAFVVNWISKASAAQRAGRAGRTGPGHCYRLYSSALFEHHFDEFLLPEINRVPIEGVVLQMKSMHIDNVVNFPFPTPPERSSLHKAEKVLTYLGALRHPSPLGIGRHGHSGQITDLGTAMSLFPLTPRFSRMLVNGEQHGCMPYVIAIVSSLSVGDPFLHDENLLEKESPENEGDGESDHPRISTNAKETQKLRRKAFFDCQNNHASLGHFTSDVFKILSVVGAYEYAGGGHSFCEENFVRPKAMQEIHKLRGQISNIVQTNFPSSNPRFVRDLEPPSAVQLKVLRQLLTAAFIDQIAVRKDRIDSASNSAQYATTKGIPYRAIGVPEDVFIHPSSVLTDRPPPEYVTFNEIVRTSRIWLKGVTKINPAWLSSLGKPSLCTFSKPSKNIEGVLMVIPRFGPDGWELPPVKADTLKIT